MEKKQAINLWNVVCSTPSGEEVRMSHFGVAALVSGAPTVLYQSDHPAYVEQHKQVAKFLRDFANALEK